MALVERILQNGNVFYQLSIAPGNMVVKGKTNEKETDAPIGISCGTSDIFTKFCDINGRTESLL